MQFQLDESLVTKILGVVDQGLVAGLGIQKPGKFCIEAAICYSLGLPHSDDPGCVDVAIRALKIRHNDSCWSSNTARAKGMRKLAILQLGTKDNFDTIAFIQRLVPLVDAAAAKYAAAAVDAAAAAAAAKYAAAAADAKYAAATANAAAAAKYAAAAAAKYAAAANAAATANAAAAADAANAANAAANAAAKYATKYATKYAAEYATKYAAAADAVLFKFSEDVATILIDMKVPGCKYLHLL